MLHNHQDERNPHHGAEHPAPAPWYMTPSGLFLLLFLGVIAYYLWTEHRAHVITFLPFSLLLLCPLMHLFMHRGHKGRGGGKS